MKHRWSHQTLPVVPSVVLIMLDDAITTWTTRVCPLQALPQPRHPLRGTLLAQDRHEESPRGPLDARHGKASKELLRIRLRKGTSQATMLRDQAWIRSLRLQALPSLPTHRLIR